MKVIINVCYGGFGISVEALKELAQINANCLSIQDIKDYYGGNNENFKHRDWEANWKKDFAEYKNIGDDFQAHPNGFNLYKNGKLYSIDDRYDSGLRTNKDLIAIVEKLGEKANDRFAKLKIVEIPDDVSFEISEYDGAEHIAETHRTWN